MAQLVGLPCKRCGRVIDSIVEGAFCPDCGSAHHTDCEPAEPAADAAPKCPTCRCAINDPGTVQSRREELRQERLRQERFRQGQQAQGPQPARPDPLQYVTGRLFLCAVMLQPMAIALVVVAVLVAGWALRTGDWDTALAFAGPALLIAALVEVVAVALYKRKRWAWTPAVVLFILSVPSVFVLPGLVGLVVLFNPRVRYHFEWKTVDPTKLLERDSSPGQL